MEDRNVWLPGAMVARLASIATRTAMSRDTKRLQVRVLRWSFFVLEFECLFFTAVRKFAARDFAFSLRFMIEFQSTVFGMYLCMDGFFNE